MAEQITATRDHQLHKLELEWRPNGSFRLARAIYWETVTDDQGNEVSRRVLPPEGIAGRALADGRLVEVLGEVETRRAAEVAEAAENRDELERLRRRDAGHRAALDQERTARQQAEAERASLAARLADLESALEQEQTTRLAAQTERDALAQQFGDLQDQTAGA